MKKKEDVGCISYIKKDNQLVLQYSNSDELDVEKLVIADMRQTKIKNDYELISCIYNAVGKSTKSIAVALKKHSSCTELLSKGKQLRFKVERESKKTFVMLPDPDNTEDEWVRIYSTNSPFNSIAKAVLDYNKYIKEQDNTEEK